MYSQRQDGFAPILLLGIVVIALVICLIVAIVVGLDKVASGNTNESMFTEGAKINDVRNWVDEKKEKLIRKVETGAEALRERQGTPPADTGAPKSNDQELDDIGQRLNEAEP